LCRSPFTSCVNIFSAPHGCQCTVAWYEYLFPFFTSRRRSGLCKVHTYTHTRTYARARAHTHTHTHTHTHHVSVRVCVCVFRQVFCCGFDNLTTFLEEPVLPRIDDDVRTCCTSFHHGLHGTVGLVTYTNTVYVTCYLCYSMCICVCRSYYSELVVGLRGLRVQFFTLLETCGGSEL
jgi:hypothetical protein